MSIVVIIAAAASTAAVHCPSQTRTTAGVLAAEQEWVEALETRDLAALSCVLDARFVDSSWRGAVIGRDEAIDVVRRRASSPTLHLDNLRVDMLGNVAIVRGINRQTGGSGAASVRFTDIFAYRRGSWRAVAAQETLIAPDRQGNPQEGRPAY